MAEIALFAPFERTLWLLFVFVSYLRLRGVEWHEAIVLPLGGTIRAWIVSGVLAVPLSLGSELGSYERAFLWVVPWLTLLVVPIYVWRRVPAALLPRVTLSELVFWNVTVIAISLGEWASSNWEETHWTAKGFVLLLASVWLWPSLLALLLRVLRDRTAQFIVKLPLAGYVWISIVFWLSRSLLDRETAQSWLLLQFAVRLWESFAAIEIFAVLYLVYFFYSAGDNLDIETGMRVGDALEGAIEVDSFRPATLIPIAVATGAAVTGFAWLNASRSWGVPVYCLLVLPRSLSEVLHALEPARV